MIKEGMAVDGQLGAEPKAAGKPKARLVLIGLTLAMVAIVGGFWLRGLGHETTDNAQVVGHVTSVSARVPGVVKKVLIHDNQLVEAGQPLVELDADESEARVLAARGELAGARASLANARAQLAITRSETQSVLQQSHSSVVQARAAELGSRSAFAQAEAELAGAQARAELASTELTRANDLAKEGALSSAELDARISANDAAVAALGRARAALETAQSSIEVSRGGVGIAKGRLATAETGPERVAAAEAAVELASARVTQAEAALRLAELHLQYAIVRAPVAGTVSRRSVEVGQMAGPERPLLALVSQNDLWIVANFKETEVAKMTTGMRARVEIDAYSGVELEGYVDSLSGGSGALFSLLPPDNASGNYVKVVQRIPVLIRLDHPADVTLRPGMSAEVTVYASHASGGTTEARAR